MERTPQPPRGSSNGYASMDGFIPNRRNRVIADPFKNAAAKKPLMSHSLRPANPTLNPQARVMESPLMKAQPAPSGVAWTPRMQDPADIELTRKTGRKSHRAKKDVKVKSKWRRAVKRSALGILCIFILIGGFLGFKFFHNIDKVFGGNFFSNISSLFNSTTLKGQTSGRVNILLAGDSSDQPGHGGADLTDSILLLSIDTNNHTAFLLSIPRDLWVNQPGVGWEKINAANDDSGTNFPGYPQNGMGQLQHLVNTDLGIPINYYALSDYGAFRDAVNAVGGVKVNIQSPDPRGLYDPNVNLRLPNGIVSLNGQTALNLARARGDGYGSYGFPNSDFDRTEHQRQIFTAIVQKAQTLGFLDNPIKISDLFDAFGNNVQTDLSLQDVLALVNLTKGVNLSNIKSYAYCSTLSVGQDGCTTPVLTDYTDPASGQEALIPTAGMGDYSQLQYYYETLTSNNPVVKEAANVVILNGGNTDGLAKQYQQDLVPKGINVTTVADAPSNYKTTEIMDDSGGNDPATESLLKSTFGNNIVPNDPAINTSGAAFVVILGDSQGPPS